MLSAGNLECSVQWEIKSVFPKALFIFRNGYGKLNCFSAIEGSSHFFLLFPMGFLGYQAEHW